MNPNLISTQILSGCETTRRLLLDLSLSADERAALSYALEHIRACDSCRAAIQDFDRISAHLGAARESLNNDTEIDCTTHQWVERAIRELPGTDPRRMRLGPLMRFSVAACVAGALGLSGYWMGHANRPGNTQAPSSWAVASIAPEELSNRVRAFNEVNKAFDDRAGWLLVSDTTSDVGLDPQPSSDQAMLVVRLMVTRRNDAIRSSGEKSVISSADLAILPGRTAKLSLPFSKGKFLSYEISVGVGSPTRLGVIAELRSEKTSDHSKPLAALSTTLDMQANGTSPAGSFVTGNSDYELTIGFSKAALAGQGSP